jgi:NitT/TauT family transport system permease protein
MKRRTWVAAAFGVVIVVVWHLLAVSGRWSPVLLPSPESVLRYLAGALRDGTRHHRFWDDLWNLWGFLDSTLVTATLVTIRRLAFGYCIGLLIGVPLGLLTGRLRIFAETIGVVALAMQGLPSVCWAPLALLWFGQTEAAMLFVVVMGTTWSIVVATEHGIRTIPPIYVRAARTMGSRRLHTLTHVVLPASLPVVVGGMKQGWAFAWRSLMAAEIFVTIVTGMGLGNLLHNGRDLMAMDQVLGIMAVIVLVGLAADKVVFAPAERWLRRRWGTES